MQWRHKQRLARWAHLGPDFVTSQRAALALDPADEWGDDDIRVVAAVAEFLDGATLPLAPDLLAEVAIEACRATGLAPAAFDDRDAYDVESIWRVGSGAAHGRPQPTTARAVGSTGADPWADSTSIVLVADPPLEVPTRPESVAADPPRPGDAGVRRRASTCAVDATRRTAAAAVEPSATRGPGHAGARDAGADRESPPAVASGAARRMRPRARPRRHHDRRSPTPWPADPAGAYRDRAGVRAPTSGTLARGERVRGDRGHHRAVDR